MRPTASPCRQAPPSGLGVRFRIDPCGQKELALLKWRESLDTGVARPRCRWIGRLARKSLLSRDRDQGFCLITGLARS